MNDDSPWLAHGEISTKDEDFLVGNRAGLQALKACIDQALASGEASTDGIATDFVGVRLAAQPPTQRTGKDTLGNRIAVAGCFVAAVIAAFIFILGLLSLGKLFN